MTVAQPRVSTAGSFRTGTLRDAMRWTPIARAMVTMAGNPSGTAATASETADMKTSRHSPNQAQNSDQADDPHAEEQQAAAEPTKSSLQRRLGLFGRGQEVRDSPQLGGHARGEDLRAPHPCGDRSPREDCVAPLGQGSVG